MQKIPSTGLVSMLQCSDDQIIILTTSAMMEKVSVAVKAIDPYDHQGDSGFLTKTESEQNDLERHNAIQDKSFKIYLCCDSILSLVYCAFDKHANSKVQKPPSQ